MCQGPKPDGGRAAAKPFDVASGGANVLCLMHLPGRAKIAMRPAGRAERYHERCDQANQETPGRTQVERRGVGWNGGSGGGQGDQAKAGGRMGHDALLGGGWPDLGGPDRGEPADC